MKLDYLARNFGRRLDPSSVLAGARTVVVCGLAYPRVEYTEPVGASRLPEPRVAAFARLDEDYHVKIKRMLRQVVDRLQESQAVDGQRRGDGAELPTTCGDGSTGSGEPRTFCETPKIRAKVCVDTASILEKAWAVEAGLGWQGRNSLVINPEYGSFLLLGEIVLDAEVDSYDSPMVGVRDASDEPPVGVYCPHDDPHGCHNTYGCGSCRACVDACPVGAIRPVGSTSVGQSPARDEPCSARRIGGRLADGLANEPDKFFIDTDLCISARTIEGPRLDGTGAPEPIHGWVHGCDVCQLVCPKNRLPA